LGDQNLIFSLTHSRSLAPHAHRACNPHPL